MVNMIRIYRHYTIKLKYIISYGKKLFIIDLVNIHYFFFLSKIEADNVKALGAKKIDQGVMRSFFRLRKRRTFNGYNIYQIVP